MQIAIIVAVNLALYFKTIFFGYVSDDLAQVNKLKPGSFFLNLWRTINGISYHNSKLAHALTLIVHTTNAVLVYVVFGMNNVSFLAALLFSVNPANLFCSVWISGGGYARGLLLTFLMYLFPAWSPLLYLSGVYLSGVMFFNPLIFMDWRLLLMPLFYLIYMRYWKKGIAYRSNLINEYHRFHGNKFIIAFKTYAYYVVYCLFPYRIGMYHNFLYAYGLQDDDIKKWEKEDIWFWGGLFAFIVSIYIVIEDGYGLRLAMWWFIIGLLPWLNLYTINQIIANRYTYLSNAALMYLVANVLIFYPYIAVALLTYYATRTFLNLNAFKNDELFLDYNLYDFNFPDQPFVWQLKGEKERAVGRPFQALESWAKGLKHRPTDTRFHFFIAKTLAELGFFNEAEYHLKKMEDNPLHDIPRGITTLIQPLKDFIAKGRKERPNQNKR